MTEQEQQPTPKTPKKRRKIRKTADQIVRIEELERIMGEQGADVDPEAIVSMYRPRRRIRAFGAALLRLDRLRLVLLALVTTVTVLFGVSFAQEKMGNFTINLNRLELYRKGIAIADNGDFRGATAQLTANVVTEAMCISGADLPGDLDEHEGDHNGEHYMAYTFFIRNAGKEDLGYHATLRVDSSAKGVEYAVRVALWHNGEKTVYAMPAANGEPEPDTESFESSTTVVSITEPEFLLGYVDKYTVVVWLEGDDPECVDSIIGGGIQFSMHFDADYEDQTNLVWKFGKDVADSLSGNNPINAAGTDAADYYADREVTWATRRNQ